MPVIPGPQRPKNYPTKGGFQIKRFAKYILLALLATVMVGSVAVAYSVAPMSMASTYVVDTGQSKCYNNSQEITCPASGQSFYGQDANYAGNTPSYTDNGDGTVTDLVTGLMWQKSPDMNGDGIINYSDKMYYDDALANASSFHLAGYNDWRLPTIKELYSLIMFYGAEPSPTATSPGSAVPFIDANYFDFGWGDLSAGERIIDAQYASSTLYVSTTMNGHRTMFGVNFADGRIKGYPADQSIGKKYYVLYVRSNTNYGKNQFVDNGDGTITDNATGLMWAQADSGTGLNWQSALAWVQTMNSQNYLGHNDWRLPDAKELQSIVDYTRSPDTSSSAAIDPLFTCTQITNEEGQADYPFYWTGTTHASYTGSGTYGVYVAFGRAMGYMNGTWVDVHGAGAQRSDPKEGNPADWPYGHGPQGDAIRIYNYVRLVRGGLQTSATPTPTATSTATSTPSATPTNTPTPTSTPSTMPTAMSTPTATLAATPTEREQYQIYLPVVVKS
jgi:hypothetical protein